MVIKYDNFEFLQGNNKFFCHNLNPLNLCKYCPRPFRGTKK